MTATSFLLATCAWAFAAQVASSQPPFAAVESSYVLNWMVNLPALLPACSSSSLIALFVSADASADAPCSGRSLETTSVLLAGAAAPPPLLLELDEELL